MVESGQYQKSTRGRLPSWFLKRPVQRRGDDFYMTAFWNLNSERQVGMGLGQIPWSKIMLYASVHQLDYQMYLVFDRVIRRLDKEYLEMQEEENQRKSRRDGRLASKGAGQDVELPAKGAVPKPRRW